MKNTSLAVAIVIIVAAVGLYLYFNYHQSQNNVFLSLMDPANVPQGTQSLNITYSSLMVHTISGNSSGWVNVAGSGTLNLLSVVNVSSILGSLYLQNGTRINLVRFNVTSSSIEINNSTYPVTLKNNQITATVLQNDMVEGTTNLILDLSPTIITVLNANSTVFIMVPSIRAILVGNTALRGASSGSRHGLDPEEKLALDATNMNITLSNAVLSTSGNVTHLSITIKDNLNESVVLRQVIVFGNQSVSADQASIGSDGVISRGDHGNLSGENDSRGSNVTAGLNGSERDLEHEESSQAGFRTVNFLVAQNGSLLLPSLESDFSGEGYTLAAGQLVTLTFTNAILLGDGQVLVKFVSGSNYKIVVQGEEDARAALDVTAS